MSNQKSVRLEIPGVTDRKIGRRESPAQKDSSRENTHVTASTSEDSLNRVLAEDKLRMTINPREEPPLNSVLHGTIHAAEERARLYEEMKSKMARRKTMKNLFDIFVLLLLLGAIVGGYIAWTGHKAKIDAEKTRLRLEAEAEQIKIDAERDKLEAEKRERLRQERAAEEQRKQEQKLAEEMVRQERRDNAERYQMFKLALKENEFDLFTKTVTNDLQTAGGELCYLLSTEKTPAPFHWVVYSTNGTANVFRLESSGSKEEILWDTFQSMLAGSEYIVAKADKVYFHSSRKKPGVGILDKSQPGNPATAFWGKMNNVMNWLKPTYDELTFDIFFTPKGEPKKKIKVENLLFGCNYSLRNVYDALEKEYPFNSSGVSSRRNRGKFKRTVKLWNGFTIRKGSDGIVYVPMNPPPQHPSYSHSYKTYSSLSGYKTIYRTRTRTRNYVGDGYNWNDLYARALQEAAAERAYYENADSAARANATTEAERKWQNKIETIFREGTLYYSIRKAKIDQ